MAGDLRTQANIRTTCDHLSANQPEYLDRVPGSGSVYRSLWVYKFVGLHMMVSIPFDKCKRHLSTNMKAIFSIATVSYSKRPGKSYVWKGQ